jgi:hypothetical protein
MEQSCRKLYVVMLMKIYFTQLMGVCFIVGFSSLVYMAHFVFVLCGDVVIFHVRSR